MAALGTSIASALGRIYYATGAGFANEVLEAFAFRPPQWASGVVSLAMTATDPTTGNETVYVFDGVLRAEHDQRAVVTLDPVQTGAPLSDHAFIVPPQLMIEIAMSDAMQSFFLGQWADGPSKSVSAYQTLVAIQQQRLPISIATRLRQYDNMLITEIRADEEARTANALKAYVTFTQILTASVEVTSSTVNFNLDPANSSMPQTTAQSLVGQVQPLPVPSAMQAQKYVSSVSTVVAASGHWSSVNLSSLL